MKMIDRVRNGMVALVPLCIPYTACADQSQVLKSWRTDAGWLTELRQHANGARVCATGKAFKGDHPFGLSIVKSGEITLVTLVDERQPPSRGGRMQLSTAETALADLLVTSEGPAVATTEQESNKTWSLVNSLSAQPLSIAVDGRQYRADLAGIEQARDQLKSSEQEAAS